MELVGVKMKNEVSKDVWKDGRRGWRRKAEDTGLIQTSEKRDRSLSKTDVVGEKMQKKKKKNGSETKKQDPITFNADVNRSFFLVVLKPWYTVVARLLR